ncbi:hypothetical protein N0V93_000173 [Gnomoniopsis smithogilvyi]|uniref:Uncharacterized protein n=1 Tax=Gnomoniopsis smithogilvyi TaxID=1191159 RepID=A0A9W9CZZ6_9PEZI|nr:hypothetical protein N0V93_000173 [Gnomoniopsis smithogilvyi]
MQTTSPPGATDDGATPSIAARDLDDRLVSDLLETTAETDVNSRDSTVGIPAQTRPFSRSHAMTAVPSSDASNMVPSPHKLQDIGAHAPSIPHKSSKRNLHSFIRDRSIASPGESEDRLVRPMPTSQSVSSHFTNRTNRRLTQFSSSVSGNTGSVRYNGNSPIRKGNNSPRTISHSVTSVLASSEGFARTAADRSGASGPLKPSRSRTKNFFTKFADVLTEQFTTKGSRKCDRSTDPTGSMTTSRETTTHEIAQGQSLNRLSLNATSLVIQDAANVVSITTAGDAELSQAEAQLTTNITKTGLSTVRKRLTKVDEIDFQNGQLLEDPFSESSSGQHTTEFEARLKSRQGTRSGPAPTDPFQAEKILETSVDAMLTTPPIGCSTPRLPTFSSTQCETPTHGSRASSHAADLITFSPGVPSVDREPRRKKPAQRGIPRPEDHPNHDSRKRVFRGRANSRPANSATSDSTRLSSYPPGSTIRHVPRSMGRLIEAPKLTKSTVESTRTLPLGRKKHPSPSKGQLELFGKYMDNNLALGVFKDADELGMSFNSPHPGVRTLSPRDTNQLMRDMAASGVDLRTGYTTDGKHTGLPKSRSRIPQPVRQLSRSRTDSAFARDFIPINRGDSTMGDELQWDASEYKIGHRCNHCGSTNKIV